MKNLFARLARFFARLADLKVVIPALNRDDYIDENGNTLISDEFFKDHDLDETWFKK